MTMKSAIRFASILYLTVVSTQVEAKVAAISFDELVRGSSVIVIARIESVKPRFLKPLGDQFARATVLEVWKGPSELREVEFLASPTWMCDISGAEVGENVVLFLELESSSRHYKIMHAGRGRMPFRKVDGRELATIWPDVVLPKGTHTEPGPEPEYDFIRSVAVPVLKQLVLKPRV